MKSFDVMRRCGSIFFASSFVTRSGYFSTYSLAFCSNTCIGRRRRCKLNNTRWTSSRPAWSVPVFHTSLVWLRWHRCHAVPWRHDSQVQLESPLAQHAHTRASSGSPKRHSKSRHRCSKLKPVSGVVVISMISVGKDAPPMSSGDGGVH